MLADLPISAEELAALQAAGLGEIGAKLLRRIEHDRQEIDRRDVKLEKLSFEIAQLRRLKFGKKSEQLDAEQRALFDEALDADIAAAEAQLQKLQGKKKPPATPGAMPKRAALPANLPRVDRHHEPENTTCACGCALKRIGEDISARHHRCRGCRNGRRQPWARYLQRRSCGAIYLQAAIPASANVGTP